MKESNAKARFDSTDLNILQAIQEDSRISNSELARRINLSQPATHTRLNRLEARGLIRNLVSLLDRDKLGLDLICFFYVRLNVHSEEALLCFEKAVLSMSSILECHYLTGQFDYSLKAVFQNRRELEQFERRVLTPIPEVTQIMTSVVLSEIKSTTVLPLPTD